MITDDLAITVPRGEEGNPGIHPQSTLTPNPHTHLDEGHFQPHDPSTIANCSIPEAVGQQGLSLHSSSSSHRPQTKGDLQRVQSGHLLT